MVLISRVTGRPIEYKAWIDEQLEQLIKTNRGDYIYVNEYGSDIPAIPGSPDTEDKIIQFRALLADAIGDYIPQIKLVALEGGFDNTNDRLAGRMKVRIRYAIRANNDEVALFESDLI